MLKYLLGIVTALIFVAAIVIWSSLPGKNDTGTAVGDRAEATSPQAGPQAGDVAAGASGAATRAGPATATRGLDPKASSRAAAVSAPMQREVIPALGFAIDVPEAWLKLDATGVRRYFSELKSLNDQKLVDALVSTTVLAAIRGWQEDGAVPNVVISHQLMPRSDVVQVLDTRLEQKRIAFDALEVIAPPAVGQLGPFRGGSMRTRETVGTGENAVVREAVIWVLRIADGYLFIAAEAPATDEEGLVLIERMLDSVSAVRDSG